MSLSKTERQEEMLKLLEHHHKMTPEDFSQILNVSMTTLRRDFKELKDRGAIFVGYGFVQTNHHPHAESNMNKPFLKRLSENSDRKKIVVEKALEYVKEDDLIFIGEGSTCYMFTKLLIKNFSSLKIITNGLYSLNALSKAKNFNVEAIGGTLLTDFNSFVGPKAENMIEDIYVDKFFFSCGSYRDGTYELSPFTASLKKKVLKHSKTHYLLIDSKKLETIAPFYAARPEEIDYIIMDDDHLEREINQTIKEKPEVQYE